MTFFGLDLSCFVCSLICVLLCWSFVVWDFMLKMFSHSQCGIPTNAGLITGTAKKLHQYMLPALIIVTAYAQYLLSTGRGMAQQPSMSTRLHNLLYTAEQCM